jgi:hypothetical protein
MYDLACLFCVPDERVKPMVELLQSHQHRWREDSKQYH